MNQETLNRHNETQSVLRKLETDVQELFRGHYEIGQLFSKLGYATYVLASTKDGKDRVLVQLTTSPREGSQGSYHLNKCTKDLQTLDITLDNVRHLEPVESLVEALELSLVKEEEIPF